MNKMHQQSCKTSHKKTQHKYAHKQTFNQKEVNDYGINAKQKCLDIIYS